MPLPRANVGRYAAAFIVAAVCFILSAGTGLFALSMGTVRRGPDDMTAWDALGEKRKLTRAGLFGIFIALAFGLFAAFIIGFVI